MTTNIVNSFNQSEYKTLFLEVGAFAAVALIASQVSAQSSKIGFAIDTVLKGSSLLAAEKFSDGTHPTRDKIIALSAASMLSFALGNLGLVDISNRDVITLWGLSSAIALGVEYFDKPDFGPDLASYAHLIDDLDADDKERGVYGSKTIIKSGLLDSEGCVEFFYSLDGVEKHEVRAHKVSFGGKQQHEFEIFANTTPGEVEIDGVKWPSREHFYQAQKFPKDSATYKAIQEAKTDDFQDPGPLRRRIKKPEYAGECRLPKDKGIWHKSEGFRTLHRANLAFFKQNREARELLLSTGKAPIVERNNHPDRWGITFNDNFNVFTGDQGSINRNYQGLILMIVRDQLRGSEG